MTDFKQSARAQYTPPRAMIVRLNSSDIICDSTLARKYDHAGLSNNAFLSEIDDWTDDNE